MIDQNDGTCYYIKRFEGERRAAYEAILAGIKNYASDIRVATMSAGDINEVEDCLLLDHPMIFYVPEFRNAGTMFGKVCSVAPQYKYNKRFVTEKTEVVKKYLRVFDGIKGKSDEAKEMYIHDYCLDNFSYDMKHSSEDSFSVLGPILNKSAVCSGIAKFVKLACDYVGLRCMVVTGTAVNPGDVKPVPHAWNMVKVNGKTYHLDVTFDITLSDIAGGRKTKRYDYFNLCDADIKKDHVINGRVPPCPTAGNDYYSVNSMAMGSISDFEKYAAKAAKQGKKSIVVKMLNVTDTEKTIEKITSVMQRIYGNGRFEGRGNANQMVFEMIVG